MTIFNSLGSNYTIKDIINSLTTPNNQKYERDLETYLQKKYGGQIQFLYQGRQAITLALQALGVPDDSYVAITGFTCFAVYQGVINAGYKLEYLDIEKNSLNFTKKTLETAYKKTPHIRAVIVQNTLGTPCDIEGIAAYCKKNNIYLIEDLAHCVGTVYDNKKLAGTVGDAIIFSFGRDKIIDAVAGGAVLIKRPQNNIVLKNITLSQKIRDRFYPFFTCIIRKTYSIKFGRVLHILLKKMGLVTTAVNNNSNPSLYTMPHWHCRQAYDQFMALDTQLEHRRQIARIYAKNLPISLLFSDVVQTIDFSSCLRFSLFVQHREDLFLYLKQKGTYVEDTWYDAPISPNKYLSFTSYKKGDCKIAEDVASHIVNIPTHRNITKQDALKIAREITAWEITQHNQ